jgi:acyl-coenzyme A synthetase/AMP-(fatty) acid ligase
VTLPAAADRASGGLHNVTWTEPPRFAPDLNGPTDRPSFSYGPDITERPLFDLLRHLVEADPNGTAVVGSTQRLSYGELLDRVLRVAHSVADAIPPHRSIATILPNSPLGFAAILGCVIAGRICIVVDPHLPLERIGTILRDARPNAMLFTDETSWCTNIDLLSCEKISLTGPLAAPASLDWVPANGFGPDEPALVHYTSGSAGLPKGIVISMRAALRRSQVYLDAWHITRNDRFHATFQPWTNSGFCSNLAALLGGARVLLHSLAGEGAASLFKLVRQERLTLLDAVPSVARLLFSLDGAKAAFAHLRIVRGGGESMLSADIVSWRQVLPSSCRIAHAYASSEAMFCAYWFVPFSYSNSEPRLPAGYPLPDQEYALVDEAGAVVPTGEEGQLILRSRHIAIGEWRDGRCVPGRVQLDPNRPGWRILHTGDLLRLGGDGMLRFVSRMDRQIKVHGVRVEPAEVEAVLRRCEGVVDAVVAVGQHDRGLRLTAFVAAHSSSPETLQARLRSALTTELPPAMLPQEIIILDRLPYLPGGKVDLRRLTGTG